MNSKKKESGEHLRRMNVLKKNSVTEVGVKPKEFSARRITGFNKEGIIVIKSRRVKA